MKQIKISVSIESPFYGEIEDGAFIKDNGGFIPTIIPTFNIPPFASRFTQFDVEEMIQKSVPHYNCEEEFDMWTVEEQSEIRRIHSDFHNSFTRIMVEPDFEGMQVDAFTIKKFRTSFEVPNNRVQEAIEFCTISESV